MPEVFVSYSTKDREIANQVVAALEEAGTSCWIAPRNIAPGEAWQAAISSGIRNAQIVLLVFSESSNISKHVHREIGLALDWGMTIVPVRLQQVPLAEPIEYALTGVEWVEAVDVVPEETLKAVTQVVLAHVAAHGRTSSPPRHIAPPGWHPDPEVDGFLRYFDGAQWTRHQSPAGGTGTPPVLPMPDTGIVRGWRFTTPDEDGVSFWDGARFTRHLWLPVSVRDLPLERTRALAIQARRGLAATERLLDQLFEQDEMIRHNSLTLVAMTAGLEAVCRAVESGSPDVWTQPDVALLGPGPICQTDGTGSEWGSGLPGGTSSRSLTLHPEQPCGELVDRGTLRISGDGMTITGAQTWTVQAAEISAVDFNALRGEISLTLTTGRPGWHVVDMGPVAPCVAPFCGTGTLKRLERATPDNLVAWLSGFTSILVSDDEDRPDRRIERAVAEYRAALPSLG